MSNAEVDPEDDDGNEGDESGHHQDDEFVRGEVRLVSHRRLTHGVYVLKREGLSDEEEFLRDLRGWLLVAPASAVFTHLTAARLLGWQLPKVPEQTPVFMAVNKSDKRPRRAGLVCSRLVRAPESLGLTELPVDTPEEILLRAARDLGLLDLVVMVDSARRLGHIDERRMSVLLASKRPGVRLLRLAWTLSNRRAESGGESLLRIFHEAMDVKVEAQVELFDDTGALVGRADLLITGTPHVQEYDGGHHRGKGQHRTDMRRERGLIGTRYQRRGYSLDDLLNHALVVMHELDRLLGRPHDMARLARWRRLVDNSLYSQQGRDRVLNRWRRQTVLVDWSKTA